MTKTSIITDGAKLDAHMIVINKAANALNGHIQLGLASAVYQSVHGRNTNHINALALNVGKGVRKAAIGDWLLKYAPVVKNDGKDAAEKPFKFSADKLAELVKAENHKAVTAEEAMAYAEPLLAKDWTMHKPDQLVPDAWSLTDAIKKLMAQAKTYEGKGTKVAGAHLLADLQQLIGAKADESIQGV